jgi:hypothetical protein
LNKPELSVSSDFVFPVTTDIPGLTELTQPHGINLSPGCPIPLCYTQTLSSQIPQPGRQP